MFKDANEELERLQQELFAEELPQEEDDLPAEYIVPDDIRSYNTDNTDIDLEQLSEELLRPRSRALTGVAAFMVLLTLAVVGLLGYLILRYMGVL